MRVVAEDGREVAPELASAARDECSHTTVWKRSKFGFSSFISSSQRML